MQLKVQAMKIFRNTTFIGALSVFFLLISCDDNRNDPGWSFFNDMEKSVAYETWSVNPNLPEGKTMTGPVEGTVATHEYAYGFEKTPEDELKAASLKNPKAESNDAERAKLLYDRFCLLCHGENGDGKGFLFTSGKYPMAPPDYHAERALEKSDGELFHNIRAGYGVMGAYGAQMSIEDSWQLVNYIRHLQKKSN